jgi:hypothetical protein
MYEPLKLKDHKENDEIERSYQSPKLLMEVKSPNHHKGSIEQCYILALPSPPFIFEGLT